MAIAGSEPLPAFSEPDPLATQPANARRFRGPRRKTLLFRALRQEGARHSAATKLNHDCSNGRQILEFLVDRLAVARGHLWLERLELLRGLVNLHRNR